MLHIGSRHKKGNNNNTNSDKKNHSSPYGESSEEKTQTDMEIMVVVRLVP